MGTQNFVLNTAQGEIGASAVCPRYAVVGPSRHGVVAHGLRLAAAEPRLAASLRRVSLVGNGLHPRGLVGSILPATAVMIQVTDRLWATPRRRLPPAAAGRRGGRHWLWHFTTSRSRRRGAPGTGGAETPTPP